MTLTDFGGRVAVVTGAGSGIGAALVRGCVAEGMNVVAADINADSVAEVASTSGSGESRVIAFEVDVADAKSVQALSDRAWAEFGQVDLLFNNAAVFQGGITWERSLEDWRWAMDVNVFGVIHGIRSFVPRMIAQDTDGHVVSTSSVAAYVSAPYSAPYIVSKSAAFSVAEVLAHDLAAAGSKIGASVLTPSAFDTGISQTASVRQAHYGSDSTEDGQFVVDSLAAMTAGGLAPDEVLGPVFDGIRQGDFLIPTKPSFAAQLDNRFQALTDRRLPQPGVVD